MVAKSPSLSKISKQALLFMGAQIKAARLERGFSQENLGERINASRYTVIAIEKGDPKVAIGYVFEAAYIVGVPLFELDSQGLERANRQLDNFKTLLPQKARKKNKEIDDDF